MDTVERLCDHVAILDQGRLVASGTTDEVRRGRPLEDVFVELVGASARSAAQDLAWLDGA
jgi:ABC-2 type transport system ATP-binding protein